MRQEAVTIKEGNALCYDCYLEMFDDLGIESDEILIIEKKQININQAYRCHTPENN